MTLTPLVSEATRLYLRDCYDQRGAHYRFRRDVSRSCIRSDGIALHARKQSFERSYESSDHHNYTFHRPSFVASLYGMNFNTEKSPLNMPELSWYFGYPLALFLMFFFSMSILMYLWFRGFLGPQRRG